MNRNPLYKGWNNENDLGFDQTALSPSKIYDISAGIDLRDWAKKNVSKSIALLRQGIRGETFRDSSGCLRYARNWLPAPDDASTATKHAKYWTDFYSTGCFELPIRIPEEKVSVDESNSVRNPTGNNTIKLLADWEKLWQFLADDERDEISAHIPLLRTFIDFFLHEKTFTLLMSLAFYNLSITLYCNKQVNGGYQYVTMGVLSTWVSLILYGTMYRLYVGWDPVEKKHEPDVTNANVIETKNVYFEGNRRINWFSAFQAIFTATYIELSQILDVTKCIERGKCRKCQNRSRKTKKFEDKKTVKSFEALLNIGIKFLIHHCEVNPASINFDRVSYKMAILCTVTVVPFFCVLYFLSTVSIITSICQNQSSTDCYYLKVYAICTLCNLTLCLFEFIFYGSIIISLVGLSYGAEMAFLFSACWVKRFSSLRRVSLPDVEEKPLETKPTVATSEADLQEAVVDRNLTFIARQLGRDSSEHYLFMVEYMRQAGLVWSPVIIALYLYGTVLIVVVVIYLYSYSSFFTTADTANTISLLVVQIILYLVFPTWSLAHANSFLNPMIELFTNATPEDFETIGGRDKWLAFVAAVPAAWTLAGLWITWSRMFTLLSAFVTAAASFTLSYFLGGN
mmetsp:Transcript_5294/g.7784  ORF Transcript_5294/g.7784 Transcript_5294/m.7784 type:complete len:625 (-) Transcript_5294:10-1884(-)